MDRNWPEQGVNQQTVDGATGGMKAQLHLVASASTMDNHMRAMLITRLERLEAKTANRRTVVYRYGYLKTLPNDFVGERHVVIVKREPSGATGQDEWCEFEERPGPAPVDAQEEDCTTIYIVYRDRLNPPGWTQKEYT